MTVSLARSFTHADKQTLFIYSSVSLAGSCTQADAAHLLQCQPCTILHAGRRCSSAAVPALHDTSRRQTLLICGSPSLARSFTQAYAAHLRQCQPYTILHSRGQTLLICSSASLARSYTHAGRRCSSAAVPALHDPSLMQADAAHLRQCQPCTILHSCRQTLVICDSASLA